MHFAVVASEDDDKTIPVVLHPLEECRYRLVAIVVLASLDE